MSLLLVILGLLATTRLPIRELPDVESPVVSIETEYTGASADVVETKITQVIEDRVAGLEGVTKITSQSIDGRSSINLEFDPDRDVDAAANDVRDRVARVSSNLPEEAEPPEIGKVDFNSEPIIFLNLSSSTLSPLELTDYAERVLVERLGVLPGVARVRMNGARRYAMRVWLDREALAARQLTVDDIESALRRENVQLPAGRLESTQREFTLRTDTGLNTEREFRELVIGRGPMATWCGSAKSPTYGSRPRTSAACRAPTACRVSVWASSRSRRQHARGGRRGQGRDGALAPGAPAGHESRGQSRPFRLHRRVDEGSRRHDGDRARAGAGRDLPVPGQPARDADPGRHDPDLDHCRVSRHGGDGVLDQRAHAARARARDRARRR
jgi:hypothetical protein